MGRPKGSKNKKRDEAAEHANGATHSLDEAKAKGEAVVAEMVRKASGPVERGRHRRKLPVKVDHGTIEAAANEMAKLVGSAERLKSERRDAMAGFKEQRAHIEGRMSELADTVTGGTVLQDIECVVYLLPTNEIQIVRVDTGEVVESRTATAEELQETLAVNGEPAPLVRDRAKECHAAQLRLVVGGVHSGWAKCVLPGAHEGLHEAKFDGITVGFEAGVAYDTASFEVLTDWQPEDPILPDSALDHEVDGREFDELAGEA